MKIILSNQFLNHNKLLIFLLVVLTNNTFSNVIYKKDISSGWFHPNIEKSELSPVINQKVNGNYIVQYFNFSDYSSAELCFKSYPDLSLFINNQLIFVGVKEEKVCLPVKEIIPSFNFKKKNIITFWHPSGKLPLKDTYIHFPTSRYFKKIISGFNDEIFPVNFNHKKESYFRLLLILLVLLTAIKYIYKDAFSFLFFKISGYFYSTVELKSSPSIFYHQNIFWLLFYFLALVTYFIFIEMNNLGKLFFNLNTDGIFEIFFVYNFIFLALFFLKYVVIKAINFFFNMNKIIVPYFEIIIYLNAVTGLFIFVGLMVFFILPAYNHSTWIFSIYFTLTLMVVIKTLFLFKFLLKSYKFSFVYLFFYLCSVELIPFVWLNKIVLNNFTLIL